MADFQECLHFETYLNQTADYDSFDGPDSPLESFFIAGFGDVSYIQTTLLFDAQLDPIRLDDDC